MNNEIFEKMSWKWRLLWSKDENVKAMNIESLIESCKKAKKMKEIADSEHF